MTAVYDHAGVQVYLGDCRAALLELPENSVQTCVTSPPYWNLRDYNVEGQIGLEPNVGDYVDHLVDVFRKVRRVLRDDGTLWLVLGDSYVSAPTGHHGSKVALQGGKLSQIAGGNRPGKSVVDLAPKNLVGVPWRVAFALQDDGWFLRRDIIWHKTNGMPESVDDRCTSAHEYIFHLSKSPDYYYDAPAIAEPAVTIDVRKFTDNGKDKQRGHGRRHAGFNGRYAEKIAAEGAPETRNKRSVWTVATQPFNDAHFAVFPKKLIEPCILAGSRPGDIVLDPFAGSGTSGEVAKQFQRRAILCELNPDYLPMIEKRLQQDVLPLFPETLTRGTP